MVVTISDTHCVWFSRSPVRGPVTNCTKHRQSTKSTTTAGLIVEHVNLGSLRAHGVRSFMFFAGKVDPTRLFCGQWPRRKRGKVKIREIAWFHLSLSHCDTRLFGMQGKFVADSNQNQISRVVNPLIRLTLIGQNCVTNKYATLLEYCPHPTMSAGVT